MLGVRCPGVRLVGLEPVEALRTRARAVGVPVLSGSGVALPFRSEAFDAVVATGVMHHTPYPDQLVKEMARVARCAVMISDTNRIAVGGRSLRLVKAAAHRLGLGRALTAVSTKGRGYVVLPTDGVHYPFSVYDVLEILNTWADRTFLVPTTETRSGVWSGPLLTNANVLAVACREPAGGSWAGRLT